jgi:hypothetical protein
VHRFRSVDQCDHLPAVHQLADPKQHLLHLLVTRGGSRIQCLSDRRVEVLNLEGLTRVDADALHPRQHRPVRGASRVQLGQLGRVGEELGTSHVLNLLEPWKACCVCLMVAGSVDGT